MARPSRASRNSTSTTSAADQPSSGTALFFLNRSACHLPRSGEYHHALNSLRNISMPSRLFRSILVRRALLIGGLLCITLIAGTTGFVLIEDFSWFEGFYMTLTTITTIGYQELHPLSHAGRVFNSILILFGVTALFVSFG